MCQWALPIASCASCRVPAGDGDTRNWGSAEAVNGRMFLEVWKPWAGFAFWPRGPHFPYCLYFSLLLLCCLHLPAIARPIGSQAQPASDSPLSHRAASKGASSPRGWFTDLLLCSGLLFSLKWKGMGGLSGPFHLCEVVYNTAVPITLLCHCLALT